MKKTMQKLLAITLMLATVLATTAYAASGSYEIVIRNSADTGLSIEGHTYHTYQIFIADDVTSYSVTDDFRAFFTGTKTGGDGSSTTYSFNTYLATIEAYEATYKDGAGNIIVETGVEGTPTADEIATYDTALNNYNQLAGHYMNSYDKNMYALAVEIRTYLDQEGAHNNGDITCMAHDTAGARQGDGYEYATLDGLDTGYYFILDGESTLHGIGIAASGAFVPLTTSSEYTTYIDVKQSIPTMTKSIYHDDITAWDIVGDSQIGDKVKFRVISTLPTNIDDYIITNEEDGTNKDGDLASGVYDYTLTDVMSTGLDFNNDVAVYIDEGLTPIDSKYYTVVETADGFTLTVNVIDFLTAYPDNITLYTYYSATLNEQAAVASDYDQNTATLLYSTNPADKTHTGSTESTVFHYTFSLDVNKVNESGAGLAGARFGIFDENGFALPLSKGEVDYTTGVVSYYYDLDATVADSDGGYITTETIELEDDAGDKTGDSVTGKFAIYGLNDQVWYTLKEVEAPEGYNTADAFDIYFTVTYDALGTSITRLTDGSAYVNTTQDAVTGDWVSTSTIVNRLRIYLPETGGTGTVLFQVGGGVLMAGAAVMLLISKRKKEEA